MRPRQSCSIQTYAISSPVIRQLVEKGLGHVVSADEKKPGAAVCRSDLSRMASVAQRMERRSKGTFGAANKGKRLDGLVLSVRMGSVGTGN